MTGKIVLRSIEQIMTGYKPKYAPLYPLFLGNAQSYGVEVGKLTFKRLEAMSDIRNKRITPKDTELHSISAVETSKVFKRYFSASTFPISNMQDQKGIEDVIAQVLDEHQLQFDESFVNGDGTQNSDVVNNGLFWTGDSNASDGTGSPESITDAESLHEAVMVSVAEADLVAGRKALIFYGESTLALFDSVYDSQPVPFKKVLGEVLDPNYEMVKMPAPITPSGEEGWIIANLDQVKLHYSAIPSLVAQGVNEEKMYSWHNFLMGNSMLEILKPGALIRQEASFS